MIAAPERMPTVTKSTEPDPEELLGYAQISELTGMAVKNLRTYRSTGRLPAPDDPNPIPDRPRWKRATIEHWWVNRPRRGRPPKYMRPPPPSA